MHVLVVFGRHNELRKGEFRIILKQMVVVFASLASRMMGGFES
jgi:hypothetical protein